jgi:heme/copper-type cytochrome/quinol oxidase subunit 2
VISCLENRLKRLGTMIKTLWRILTAIAKFLLFAESGGLAIYMMKLSPYSNNTKGVIQIAIDILLLTFTVLVWFPRALSPVYWEKNKVLRRTLTLCLSIVLTVLGTLSRHYYYNSELVGQVFITFGPISLTILATKWWWDDEQERPMRDTLLLLLIGLLSLILSKT